jgi:hypothetical protein
MQTVRDTKRYEVQKDKLAPEGAGAFAGAFIL